MADAKGDALELAATELSCTVAGCMAVVSLEQTQQSRWLKAERPSSGT